MDWLPVYRSKFSLHLEMPVNKTPQSNSLVQPLLSGKGSHTVQGSDTATKQQSGYSRDCVSFVAYDPAAHETKHQTTKECYQTSHLESYGPPLYTDKKLLKKPFIVAQKAIDSGFTHLPIHCVTDQGQTFAFGKSEAKSKYIEPKSTSQPQKVNKSGPYNPESAYTSNVGHIFSFGPSLESPFDKPPRPCNHLGPLIPNKRLAQRMDPDGFTRSEGPRILDILTNPPGYLSQRMLDHTKRSDPTRWISMNENGQSTSRYIHCKLSPIQGRLDLSNLPHSISHKQATGSTRNNRPFVELNETSSTNRFTTESSERYGVPKSNFKTRGYTCNGIVSSGFTSSNKYQYAVPTKTEVLLNSL
ncbi:hypothetical protein BSLG_006660 [Batrachochytrium salamandrivorans]|nr:hypothetical protein BSLG_006660 [Batrachochytrium salamandrivorans]